MISSGNCSGGYSSIAEIEMMERYKLVFPWIYYLWKLNLNNLNFHIKISTSPASANPNQIIQDI